MGGAGDNVAVFRLLGDEFPDEHITSCVDARVVSTSSSSVEDPEDPAKMLCSITHVLVCPHVLSFELTVLATVVRRVE